MRHFTFVSGAAVLSAVILLNGCASKRAAIEREIPEAFPYHTVDQILFNLQTTEDPVDSYRAKAAISIKTADDGGQFSAEMHARRNDSLYVSISPGLGIEAARALVTPDSFYFYDRIKNRLVYGSLEESAGILPRPFASRNLFENLLGLIVPSADIQWEVSADTSYYYLRDVDGTMTYAVDPAFWRVVRFEERLPNGVLVERRTFDEFDEFDDLVLPRRVRFERPTEDQRASIYYRDLTLNPDRLSFDLRVRDSAERVQASD